MTMGLNHSEAMLSPEGLKTLFCPTETRSQTFQLEVQGTKSIVSGQYGHRVNEAHETTLNFLPNFLCIGSAFLNVSFAFLFTVGKRLNSWLKIVFASPLAS